MFRRVALEINEVSKERTASITKVIKIDEPGKPLAVTISVFLLLVTANICSKYANSCHLDDGGDTFLQNIGSYKSHTT
jgi:hypothetical protein